MEPVVSEVGEVREALPGGRRDLFQGYRHFGPVLQLAVGDTEFAVRGPEHVQVAVVPAERRLDDPVQSGERGVGGTSSRRQIGGFAPFRLTLIR